MASGDLLFNRRAKLVVASPSKETFNKLTATAVEIADLRLQFKIEKNLQKEPNSAEITITNLSAASRASMPGKGAKIFLEAGYDATLAQIFVGDARLITHTHEGPDWTTVIQCGDGARSFLHARINESFAGGVPGSEIVNKIAGKLGLNIEASMKSKLDGMTGEFLQGYSAYGPASKELDKVLRALGYEWSIQDETLQILKPGENTDEQVPDLGPDSGLIGSLEHGSEEKKGAKPVFKGRCLLRPEIKPGCKINVRSSLQTGGLRITRLVHSGDTAGGDWYTDFEGNPL